MKASEMVKELVNEHGYSMYRIAQVAQCGQSTIQYLYKQENGRGRFTTQVLTTKIRTAYKLLKKLKQEAIK